MARSKNYIPSRQSMHGEVKKIYRCFRRLAVHLYLIGPICQFALSTRSARIGPGADPIFRSACCAGYCQDNGAGSGGCGGRCVPSNFHRKPLPTSSQFFRHAQEIWSALDHIFEDLCSTTHCTYIILRYWLGLLFSNFRTGKTSETIAAGIKNLSALEAQFLRWKREDVKMQRNFFY